MAFEKKNSRQSPCAAPLLGCFLQYAIFCQVNTLASPLWAIQTTLDCFPSRSGLSLSLSVCLPRLFSLRLHLFFSSSHHLIISSSFRLLFTISSHHIIIFSSLIYPIRSSPHGSHIPTPIVPLLLLLPPSCLFYEYTTLSCLSLTLV